MGSREFEDNTIVEHEFAGCHVVAPVSYVPKLRGLRLILNFKCPHDAKCPLLQEPGLLCSFSQRLQRPTFVRKTKNVRGGHEDVGYSYVVVRRGKRPRPITTPTNPENHHPSETDVSSINAPATATDEQMRTESYGWPRLVFPPMKKSGHVILDSCTAEGTIFAFESL